MLSKSYPAFLGVASGLLDDLYPILYTSPFQLMDRMQQDMDRLFSQMIGTPQRENRKYGAQSSAAFLTPKVDVSETDTGYQIDLDLPGVLEDAIDIRVVEGMLIVRAELREEFGSEPQGGEAQSSDDMQDAGDETAPAARRYHYRERRWGRFERAFSLPTDAEEANIQAKFADGVLTLTLPKKVQATIEQPEGRRIAITSAKDGSAPSGKRPKAAGTASASSVAKREG